MDLTADIRILCAGDLKPGDRLWDGRRVQGISYKIPFSGLPRDKITIIFDDGKRQFNRNSSVAICHREL